MSTQHNKRPKILFYAPILEYPPAGGPQMSVTNAIKALNQLCELHIVTNVPKWRLSETALSFFRQHSAALVFSPGSIWHHRSPKVDRLMQIVKREVVGPVIAQRDAKAVANYARKNSIDIIWVDRVLEHAFYVYKQLRKRVPDTRIVGDTEAVHSRFILRELPLLPTGLRKMWVQYRGRRAERQERHLVESADAVTAVSQLDADFYKSISSRPENIKLFSNIVDLGDFQANRCEKIPLKTPYVLLIGSYGHKSSPMDRAAMWMLEEIMPLVRRSCPDVHFYIVGRNSDKTLGHYSSEHVTVTGKVPSVLPYLKGTVASLVPLKYESGTRFKILETGAAEVACISTTLGAEGLRIENGKDIMIADTAEDFAQAIVDVVNDRKLTKSLAANLNRLIRKHYSLDVQVEDGRAIIRHLLGE